MTERKHVKDSEVAMVARGAAIVLLCLWAARAPMLAHPHPGDVVTDTIRGRVSEINLERHTIAVDALDRKTKQPRSYLMFLDPKVKITRAKKKVPLTELTPGQPVVCIAEIELNERGEQTKMIAFDIKFDLTARPALY